MPKYKIKIENNNLEQIGKAVITSDRKIEFTRTGIKGLSNFIENNFYNISFINIALDKFNSKFFAAVTLIQDFSFFSDEIKVERRKGYFKVNYNDFEFVFIERNTRKNDALMLKDTIIHEDLLSKEKIEALEKLSELFPLISFQKMNFEINFKRMNKNWFELEHKQKNNDFFLEGNENVNLFSSKDRFGNEIYKIRFKNLDKIYYQVEKRYLNSEFFIETGKETIKSLNWMKYLKYTEKQDNFFKFLILRKNVKIKFDFKNKKFYFEDNINENKQIKIVKRIKEIFENISQFVKDSDLDDVLKIFELYLAKFENKKVDERIEMIKDFKI